MKPLFVFVLALALCACSEEEKAEAASGGQGPPPAKVEVVDISETSLISKRRFLGEVRNAESTVLAAGGSGLVTKVNVKEGDAVKRGQVLVQLDDSILRAQLREQESSLERMNVDLEQAKRNAQRFSTLSESGAATGVEAEQAVAQRDSLVATATGQEASIRRVREEIAQMRIVAPVDGVVASRNASPGQWLTSGTTAIELASQGALEVHVRVPSDVLDVLDGEPPVTIVRGDDTAPASVAGVVGSLDPRTRTALLRVLPNEPPAWLREGDAVEVDIALKRETDGVVVPTDALVFGISGARIFRVADGKAEPHDVTVVAQNEGKALVKAPNLKTGDTVVRAGNERLRPGQPLQVSK